MFNLKELLPRWLFVLLFVLNVVPVASLSVKDFTVHHLGKEEGALTQRVYTICQMDDGAIWWSAKCGVERYNGVAIKFYPMTLDSSAVAGQKVMLRKCGDRLFAHDNRGYIYLYNKVYDRLEQINDQFPKLYKDIQMYDFQVVGNVGWAVLDEGIYRIDIDDRDKAPTAVAKGLHTQCIIPADGQLYFGAMQGVYSLDKDGKSLRKLSSHNVESGYYDRQKGELWIGTFNEGVIVIDVKRGTEKSVPDIPNNPVRSILSYDNNTVLVGIDGKGVYSIERQTGYRAKLFADANGGIDGVLHGNGIYSMLRDMWGNIIIGSYSGGIDMLRPVGCTTAMFNHLYNNPQSLANDHVNCVFETTGGLLLMGTDNGLSIFDPQTSFWHHTLDGMVVLDIIKDRSSSDLLLATYGKGVYRMAVDGKASCLYSTSEGTLRTDYVFTIYIDRDGTLWMGCLNGPLVEKNSSGVRYYDIQYVEKVMQLPNGLIAVSTTHGIYTIDKRTGKTSRLDYQTRESEYTNMYVVDMFVDGRGRLWIATNGGGVYIYDLSGKGCQNINISHGLPSNCVTSIYADKQRRVWVATDQGLTFIDDKLHISNVNYCNGIEREYCDRAVVQLHNGQLLYGSTTGAIVINPKIIRSIDYKVKFNLVRIRPDSKSVLTDEEAMLLDKMLNERNIVLDYGSRTFELYYEGINIRNQYDVVYTYRVGSSNWSQPSDQQMIRFSNMEPGRHKVVLRCVSKSCGTVLDEITLTIVINEPWWNSWWMWIVYTLLVIAAFIALLQVYRLHNRYMRLSVQLAQTNNNGSIVSEHQSFADVNPEAETEQESAFVNLATTIIIDNITDADFTIDVLCKKMAMSRTLFYVKLKSLTGKSPQDFIRVIRLERAAALLRSGKSVGDAAALAGFDNPKYFSTVFKKYFGVSPSRFK